MKRKTPEEWLAARRKRWALAFELTESGEASLLTAQCVVLVTGGLGIPQIADALGKSRSRIAGALNDPTGVKGQARKKKRFGLCLDCGRKTFNSGSPNTPKHCQECKKARVRREAQEKVVKGMQLWARLYGSPPSAADWNVAHARRVASPERLAAIEERHREHKWPLANSAVRVFGSWNAAIEAAGFRPLTAGERRT